MKSNVVNASNISILFCELHLFLFIYLFIFAGNTKIVEEFTNFLSVASEILSQATLSEDEFLINFFFFVLIFIFLI
jgi:hypothetical protein